MKAFQKILGAVMAATMMAMSFAAYAETTDPATEAVVETTVMPRAERCSSCEKGSMIKHTFTGASEIKTISCTHGYIGYYDTVRITPYYYYYQCNNCGKSSAKTYSHSSTVVLSCSHNG